MTKPVTPPLMTFPCDFPVKVVGRNGPEFEDTVLSIVRRHFPALPASAVSTRQSSGGKFTAITFNIEATSQQQLDALYRELSETPTVLMAL